MEPTSSRKNPYLFIVLALLVVLVGGGVLWSALRSTAPAPETPVQPAPTPTATATRNVTYTLYLPNENALLSTQTVTEPASTNAPLSWQPKARRAMELLFARLKDLPPKTKLLSPPAQDKNGVVTVNFSPEIRQLEKRGETVVALVFDAMSSTLGAVDGPQAKPVKMKILIEGKPVPIFSEFDLSIPWASTQPQDETPPDAESVR